MVSGDDGGHGSVLHGQSRRCPRGTPAVRPLTRDDVQALFGHACMTVRQRVIGRRRYSSEPMSEPKDQAKCRVNRAQLIETEVTNPLSEPTRIDGAGLLGEHQRLVAVHLDERSERCWSSRGGGGCDQPGGQGFEVVRLHDDGEAMSLLRVSAGAAWRA